MERTRSTIESELDQEKTLLATETGKREALAGQKNAASEAIAELSGKYGFDIEARKRELLAEQNAPKTEDAKEKPAVAPLVPETVVLEEDPHAETKRLLAELDERERKVREILAETNKQEEELDMLVAELLKEYEAYERSEALSESVEREKKFAELEKIAEEADQERSMDFNSAREVQAGESSAAEAAEKKAHYEARAQISETFAEEIRDIIQKMKWPNADKEAFEREYDAAIAARARHDKDLLDFDEAAKHRLQEGTAANGDSVPSKQGEEQKETVSTFEFDVKDLGFAFRDILQGVARETPSLKLELKSEEPEVYYGKDGFTIQCKIGSGTSSSDLSLHLRLEHGKLKADMPWIQGTGLGKIGSLGLAENRKYALENFGDMLTEYLSKKHGEGKTVRDIRIEKGALFMDFA